MSGHWWCQHCNQELSSHEVTFEENHSACGGTAIWIEEEDIGELEFLKRQLSEAGKKVDELYQENLTLKADMVSNKQECCACQKERNELQAQVAVLRGAVIAIERYLIGSFCVNDKQAWTTLETHKLLMEASQKSAATTPSEAAERVQKLVEALEFYEKFEIDIMSDEGEKARSALAAWRKYE